MLREELLEFRLSGELFQLELRELQFTLLFQLPPSLARGTLPPIPSLVRIL